MSVSLSSSQARHAGGRCAVGGGIGGHVVHQRQLRHRGERERGLVGVEFID